MSSVALTFSPFSSPLCLPDSSGDTWKRFYSGTWRIWERQRQGILGGNYLEVQDEIESSVFMCDESSWSGICLYLWLIVCQERDLLFWMRRVIQKYVFLISMGKMNKNGCQIKEEILKFMWPSNKVIYFLFFFTGRFCTLQSRETLKFLTSFLQGSLIWVSQSLSAPDGHFPCPGHFGRCPPLHLLQPHRQESRPRTYCLLRPRPLCNQALRILNCQCSRWAGLGACHKCICYYNARFVTK